MTPRALEPSGMRLKTLRSNERTIVLCTHNLAEAEELADQVAIIRRGKILMNGTPEVLKQSLLGPAVYEAEFSMEPPAQLQALPEGVSLTDRDGKSLFFKIDFPDRNNPLLLRQLLNAGLDVTSFRAVPRSLEQAYLRAITQGERGN